MPILVKIKRFQNLSKNQWIWHTYSNDFRKGFGGRDDQEKDQNCHVQNSLSFGESHVDIFDLFSALLKSFFLSGLYQPYVIRKPNLMPFSHVTTTPYPHKYNFLRCLHQMRPPAKKLKKWSKSQDKPD